MGVEEEFLLVGPTGDAAAVAGAVLTEEYRRNPSEDGEGTLGSELKQEQLETATHPCEDLTALAAEIRRGRHEAQVAAERSDASIAAVGTCPPPVRATANETRRYRRMNRDFALTAREQLSCGCHVHVAVEDDEEAVAVIDRIGPWLSPLLALSVNSPFWDTVDSGFHSYRAQVWSRWPTAGPTAPFGSAQAYHDVVDSLVATGTILDEAMIYFDARVAVRYPTVEIRVADVCLDADDTVLIAALTRGLVETAAREAAAGLPVPDARVQLLRAATWRASRAGTSGALVDPQTFRPRPADEVVDGLVDHVRDALRDTGDLDLVEELLTARRSRGSGADLQRQWYAETGDLREVARRAAARTVA